MPTPLDIVKELAHHGPNLDHLIVIAWKKTGEIVYRATSSTPIQLGLLEYGKQYAVFEVEQEIINNQAVIEHVHKKIRGPK